MHRVGRGAPTTYTGATVAARPTRLHRVARHGRTVAADFIALHAYRGRIGGDAGNTGTVGDNGDVSDNGDVGTARIERFVGRREAGDLGV